MKCGPVQIDTGDVQGPQQFEKLLSLIRGKLVRYCVNERCRRSERALFLPKTAACHTRGHRSDARTGHGESASGLVNCHARFLRAD